MVFRRNVKSVPAIEWGRDRMSRNDLFHYADAPDPARKSLKPRRSQAIPAGSADQCEAAENIGGISA